MRLVAWWPCTKMIWRCLRWAYPGVSRSHLGFSRSSKSLPTRRIPSGQAIYPYRAAAIGTLISKKQLKLVSNSGADMMPKLARHLFFSACFRDCRLVLVGQKGRRVLQNLLLFSLEVPDVWGCVSWKLRLDRIGWPWFLMVRLFPADRSSWGLGIVPNWTCCNGTLVDLGVLAASA